MIGGCIFNGNKATSDYGGAIALPSSTSAVVVTNSTFSVNKASVAGGAIYAFEASDVNITLANMNKNKAVKGGG